MIKIGINEWNERVEGSCGQMLAMWGCTKRNENKSEGNARREEVEGWALCQMTKR